MFGKLFEWFVGLFVELLMKWKVTDAILRKLSGFREPERPFEEAMMEWVKEIHGR